MIDTYKHTVTIAVDQRGGVSKEFDWCKSHIGNDSWIYGYSGRFYNTFVNGRHRIMYMYEFNFKDEGDAVMFKLIHG